MFAAMVGKVPVVRFLLEKGADPEAEDERGNSAMSLADTQGADEVVEILRSAIEMKKPSR